MGRALPQASWSDAVRRRPLIQQSSNRRNPIVSICRSEAAHHPHALFVIAPGNGWNGASVRVPAAEAERPLSVQSGDPRGARGNGRDAPIAVADYRRGNIEPNSRAVGHWSSSVDRFVVISACSSGGKSTLIAELGKRGYAVVDEPGRRIVPILDSEWPAIKTAFERWLAPENFDPKAVSECACQR